MDDRTAGRRIDRIATACVVAFWLAFAAGPARAASVEREGMRFDDAIVVGDSRVVLNGVGVRAAGWFKGYVAALYLPQMSSDPEAILAAPGTKRIAVKLLIDVGPELLAKTFADGIRKNYKDDALEALRPRMETFDAQIRGLPGHVRKGEEIDLDFHPGSGTRVLVRGKAIGTAIPGEDFYVALLKMFIGERAVDKGLRADLLGSSTHD